MRVVISGIDNQPRRGENNQMPNATNTTPNVQPKTYLRATLKDGTKIVSSFEKLANVQKYAAQIFARVNVFNAWELVARVHPTSGEPCLVRRRRMISGDQITEIERVVPISFEAFGRPRDDYENAVNNYDPDVFESAVEIQSGEGGTWVAPTENAPEGATPGQRYPIHIDATTLARYVILNAERNVRFQLEANRAVSEATIDELTGGRTVDGPVDGDEDIDEDEIRER
jgi:hypothetical protein